MSDTTRKALAISNMACRIQKREDNLYSRDVISNVLKMYMDECKKSLLKGERVQITGIGTIIPEVKTHRRRYFLPNWDNEMRQDSPYTRVKMTRNYSFGQEMNRQLQKNIENGILGLEELPFDKQQITNLRNGGFIPDEKNE